MYARKTREYDQCTEQDRIPRVQDVSCKVETLDEANKTLAESILV